MMIIKHRQNKRLVKTYRFESGLVSIGSSRFCQIRLFGEGVAPQHAVLERHEDGPWLLNNLEVPGSRATDQPSGVLKINGKHVVEAALVSACNIEIGGHTLEFLPYVNPRREVFKNFEIGDLKTSFKTSNDNQLIVIKKNGHVVFSEVFPASQALTIGNRDNCDVRLRCDVVNLPVARRSEDLSYVNAEDFRIFRVPVSEEARHELSQVRLDPELRKPMGISFATIALFVLIFLGIPMPKEDKKPESNQFTKMIFDSKILKSKREKMKSSEKFASAPASNTNQKAQGPKLSAQTTKTISNLRNSGLQSMIGKIAARASQSAKFIASLGAMPTADASTGPAGSVGSAMGKVVAVGVGGTPGKGTSVGVVGTGGKAGGAKGYKDGTGLGQGRVGVGEIGMDDEDSNVEGGLDKEIIASVIREHLGQIRYCYERQLSGQPDLMGKVKVRFGIDAQGEVFTQSVGDSTLKNANVEECILRRVAKWKFPKPKGGTQVNVSYPFIFKSIQ